MAQALVGRKGPVYCDIPLDIQPRPVENAEARLDAIVARIRDIVAGDQSFDTKAAAAIIPALTKAERPVVVLGNGLRIAGVSRERIRSLVETIGAPVLTTWASFDLLPHAHDLNFGSAGGLAPTHSNAIIQNADLLVFLGTRLDLLTTAFNPENYGKNAKRLVVECDAAEIAKNAAMTNTTFFQENVTGVVAALEAAAPKASCHTWLETCRIKRTEDALAEAKAFGGTRFTTYQLARVLAECPLTPYVVPTASGFACEGLARFFKPAPGATFAWAGHVLGSMGLGLPCAIGAAAALHTPVVCVEGDGGILHNVQEIFTIAANPQLPLTLVIMNNGGYQSIIKSQMRAFGKEFGASNASGLGVPKSFDRLAEAAGLAYERCDTVEQFEQAMARTSTGQRLIEVMLEEDGYRGPSVTTKFTPDGKPYSTDIGDVTWDRPT
jgi:acetolactate synthase-1/2/3 large subunit